MCDRILGDKYKLGPLISSGGMGRVFHATDVRLGTEVAIKLLAPLDEDDPRRGVRFLREARAVAELRHPNVVDVLDFGVDDGESYLVMELLVGETLRARLERVGRLDLAETGRLLTALARGVDCAHRAGIAHCDLKPENVFLAGEPGDEHVKLLDFGLARPAHDVSLLSTASRSPMGTPAYMSPEQATGGEVGPASDLWSLGVIAFECLVGRRPFDGETIGELILQICSWPLPVPSRQASLSVAVDAWWSRACVRDPAARFASAGELAAALLETRRTRGSRGSRRRWRMAIVVTAALALGFVAPDRISATPGPIERAPVARIAVLPLDGLVEPDGEALAEGATGELIASIGRMSGRRVIAHASVMRFRRPEGRDLRAIARELRADAVIVGTLRQVGANTRLAVELIDGDDATVRWSRTYVKPAGELEGMTIAAASDLAAELGGAARIAPRKARDPAAYRAFLRGRYFWNKRDDAGLHRAIEQFEEALRIEPDYARAWVGMADAYQMLPWTGPTPEREAYDKSRAALVRALSLDPASSEAHATRGNELLGIDWKFADAERAYRRALELDPQNASAHQWLGELLTLLGRHAEAVAEMDRALDIDPLSAATHKFRAQALYFGKRYVEGLAAARLAVSLDPGQPFSRAWLGYLLVENGQYDEGLREIRADPVSIPPIMLAQEMYVAKQRGDLAEVERLLPLAEQSGLATVSPMMMAYAYAVAGRAEPMFALLDHCVTEKAKMTPILAVNPMFDPYRGDPRMAALIARLGL